MLLLFKPWRNLRKDLLICAVGDGLTNSDNPWENLYIYFQKWFADLQALNASVRLQYASQCHANEAPNLLDDAGIFLGRHHNTGQFAWSQL
jgi:hypothetical protein